MPARTRRHLDILQHEAPLRRYALTLAPDANAAGELVHRAMMDAFAQPPTAWISARVEAALRTHVDAAARGLPPAGAAA